MNTKEKHPNQAGIYKLTCKINNKVYIGKTFNFRKRFKEHQRLSTLTKGKSYFHRAIAKHGWDSFNIEILDIFENFNKQEDNSKLLEKESHYIEFFDSTNVEKGYNLCKNSADRTGCILTEDHKRRISEANKGKKFSNETKNKMRLSKLGTTRSIETKQKMSDSKKGKPGRIPSQETREKMRLSKLGKTLSEESKEKVRLSLLGRPCSEETREKIRKSNKENPNMSMLGRKHTEESKQKMRKPKIKRDEN